MLKYLKEKWNISSNFQLFIIFIVFAITGTTSAKLAVPLLELLNIYPSIFEGFFQYNNVLVRPDIMVNNNDGSWDFIEVKSSTQLKPENIRDLLNGLKLIGDFMEKTILKPNNVNYPISRNQFINSLS